jgi:hypothetical protein
MRRWLGPDSLRAVTALSALWLCASAGPAHANLLVNGGFDDPVQTPGSATIYFTGLTIPVVGGAWTVLGDPGGPSIYLLEDTYAEPFNDVTQFNAQQGKNSVDLSGPINVGPSAGVEQIVPVIPGRAYALSFWVGRVTPTGGPGGVYPSAAIVDLSIDGGTRFHFTNGDVTNGRINWKKFIYHFSPTGDSVRIDFLNGTPFGSNETGLDSVSLDPVTPVPALPGWGRSALVGLLAAAAALRSGQGRSSTSTQRVPR